MGGGEKQTQAMHSLDTQPAGPEAAWVQGKECPPPNGAQCALGGQVDLRIIPAHLSLDWQPAEVDATEFCNQLPLHHHPRLQSLHPFWKPRLSLCSSLTPLLSSDEW